MIAKTFWVFYVIEAIKVNCPLYTIVWNEKFREKEHKTPHNVCYNANYS